MSKSRIIGGNIVECDVILHRTLFEIANNLYYNIEHSIAIQQYVR